MPTRFTTSRPMSKEPRKTDRLVPEPIHFDIIAKINISGHSCSTLILLVLIFSYFKIKPEFTIMDRNIICLSVFLALSHLLQLTIVFLSKAQTYCKLSAVLLHWFLLLSFSWIATISFDLYRTFKAIQPITSHIKKQRFKSYCIMATLPATIIVLICVVIGIPHEDYSGYGYKERCFIAKFWANLFAFTLPVILILLASIVLTIMTMLRLRSQEKKSKQIFSNGNSRAPVRKRLIITALTLKLSVLLGFGWIVGFINGFLLNVSLQIIFNIILSSQGTFIYLAFGCHKPMVDMCVTKLNTFRYKVRSTDDIKTQTATSCTAESRL